jgi:transcriptional regulator with XRE-family HTH domain
MTTKYNIKPLDRARQLKRLSTTQLAARIGLSDAMVRSIFTGRRRPSEKTVFAMSQVLDVPMEEIIAVSRKRSA